MVHQYKFDGQGWCWTPAPARCIWSTDVAYDVVALRPKHSPEEIEREILARYGLRPDVTAEEVRECIADVDALIESGQLYTPDDYEPLAGEFKRRQAGVVKASASTSRTAATSTAPTASPSQGKYHGERAIMSYEVGRRALDFWSRTPAAARTSRSTSSAASRF